MDLKRGLPPLPNAAKAELGPSESGMARVGSAFPATPPRSWKSWAGAPGPALKLAERINLEAENITGLDPHSSSSFYRRSAIGYIQPPVPPVSLSSRLNSADSPQAATVSSSSGSWNTSDPRASNFLDPEIDVFHSPSLPKNFAFSTTPTKKDNRDTVLVGKAGRDDPFFSPKARGSTHVADRREDPYVNSDDSYDSDDSDCSDGSQESDVTITPASYATSVASHSRTQQRQALLVDNLKALLLGEPDIDDLADLVPASFINYPTRVECSSDEEKNLTSGVTEKMAPSHVAKNGTTESSAAAVGPHLGTIKVGHQYICECHIRRLFAEKRLDAAREANYRLQGVQVIECTREALLLPVRTYNAACTFYHRFRLEHPAPDYNYTDAALASLFVACKVEDTLKKSREVLCAHHNLKNPDHQTTQDDKIFDQPSKVIIGIERYMVEAINFDFRVRYPQKILAKIVKRVLGKSSDFASFFPIAMKMSIDLYKTYAPLKHSSYTCALVIAQLTAMITGRFIDEFQALDPLDWHTDEQCVAEVMLDLLDLYAQHGKVTKVGPMFDLQIFIDTQINVNQFVERTGLFRYLNQCKECESVVFPPTPSTGSPMSLSTPSAAGTSTVKRGPKGPDGGTTRFVFDADEAVRENKIYNEYTKDEWEEWEEEIEEPILDHREDRRHEPRGPRGPRGHGHGHGHGPGHGRGHGRGGFDPGWTPRNRHDRRRRGGGFY